LRQSEPPLFTDALPAAIPKPIADLSRSAIGGAERGNGEWGEWRDRRSYRAAYAHTGRGNVEGIATKRLHLPVHTTADASGLGRTSKRR
jgi:hypothetical protein